MFKFIKAHWLAIPTAILVIIAGVLLLRGKETPLDTYVATARDLREEVSVTGRVKPSQEVDLAFQQSGLVAKVGVKVSDRVGAKAVLASLDNSNLAAQIAQAEASVLIEEATLASLQAGNRVEDVEISRIKMETARQTLANKETLLAETIGTAYVKVENSFRSYIDQFFTNPRSSNPQLNIQVRGEYELDLERDRQFIEARMVLWKNYESANEALRAIRDFVSVLAVAINDLSPTASMSTSVIDGYKADISSMRNTIEAELSNLTLANQSLSDARLSLSLAEDQYELSKSPARPEDIAAEVARVARAKAEVSRLQAGWRERILYAPFGGLITKVDYSVGETVSAGSSGIKMISDLNLQIEANIPEADIANIKVGQVAEVTLDAYSDKEIFFAHVVEIDPAETVIEGVPTYRVVLVLDQMDERIKTGMTANIVIINALRSKVVAVPNRLLTLREGKSFVTVETSLGPVEKEVKTGLRSADGYTEIISGLEVGQRLIDATTGR